MAKPWITKYGRQKESTSAAVDDLYHSPNVFINGVSAVLYAEPGPSSSAYTLDIAAPQISAKDLNKGAVEEAKNLQPQSIPATTTENGGPEDGYQGTPQTAVTDVPGKIDPALSDDIVRWLGARVEEANRGMWTRVSPPVPAAPINPGNPNIIGIWESLGIKSYASNDQTAWCMGFVNFALKQCGYKWCPEASSWAIRNNPGRWGATAVPTDQGQPGDIALWSYGHVNIVYTANNGKYTFVGGNQGGKTASAGGTKNNPVKSTVSISWPSGYGRGAGDGTLVGLWRPTKK